MIITISFCSGMKLQFLALLAAFPLFAALPQKADAVVTINLVESGGNVVAQGGGTANLTALTLVTPSPPSATGLILSATAGIAATTIGVGSGSPSLYRDITGPLNFGIPSPPVATLASSTTGQFYGIFGGSGIGGTFGQLIVPNGYVSGAQLPNSTATWTGQTLASLSVAPGTYTWTWGSGATADSFVVNISRSATAAVPGPLPLFGAGAAFAWSRRLRSRLRALGTDS